MLRENTAFTAMELARQLTNNAIRVVPMDNTPLEQLIKVNYTSDLSPVVQVNENTGETQISGPEIYVREMVAASKKENQMGEREHDLCMEELTNTVSSTVERNLELARTVVSPVIKEVAEDTQNFLNEFIEEAANPVQVLQDFYKDIWSNQSLHGMVDRYAETIPQKKTLTVKLRERTGEALLEMVKTGSRSLDADIQSFIDDLEPTLLGEVYDRVFRAQSNSSELTDHLNLTQNSRDEILIMFLISRRLLESPDSDINMALPAWRDYMSTLVSQSGRTVYRVINQRKRDREQKKLIVQYPNVGIDSLSYTGESIVVNHDVYKDWLNEGGAPEILFGAYLTDRQRGYQALLDQREYYLRAWARHDRIEARRAAAEHFNNNIIAYRKAMTKAINNIEEDAMVTSRDKYHERLYEALKMIGRNTVTDHYRHARRLVTRVMYAHTDAETLLEMMDEISEQYPEMPVREVALLSTIDVVTNWTAQLMKTEDVVASNPDQDTNDSTMVLANAAELSINVIMQIAGNAIANKMDNQTITPTNLSDTVCARLKNRLARYMTQP